MVISGYSHDYHDNYDDHDKHDYLDNYDDKPADTLMGLLRSTSGIARDCSIVPNEVIIQLW